MTSTSDIADQPRSGAMRTLTPVPRILPPKPRALAATPKDFICAVCYELPVSASDALVTPCCQHLFCTDCISVTINTSQMCPFDRKKLRNIKDLNQLDGLARRVFESIPVACPRDGCDWDGCAGNYYRHAEECSVSDVSKVELARMLRKAQTDLIKIARLCKKSKKALRETVDRMEEQEKDIEHLVESSREDRKRLRQFNHHYEQVERTRDADEEFLNEKIDRLEKEKKELKRLLRSMSQPAKVDQTRERRKKREKEGELRRAQGTKGGTKRKASPAKAKVDQTRERRKREREEEDDQSKEKKQRVSTSVGD